jgi:feruloyl-CoA synthase
MSLKTFDDDHAALGLRDPRYAPRRLVAERRRDGSILLTHPGSTGPSLSTALDALERWAGASPAAPWLAERAGAGWRVVNYGEGLERVRALAGGLNAMGLTPEAPLLVLARNGIDHALIAFAAMSQAIPVAAISPQYGLGGAILSRLAHAVSVMGPAAVLVDDARDFATALESDILSGLPVIATRHARPGDMALDNLLRGKTAANRAKPDDIAKLLLTSGSTGAPKAVMCLHRAVAVTAAQVAACYDDPEPPVVVNQAPWSHSLGANAILQMITHRGGTLYIDAGAPVAGRHLETVRNLEEIAPTYHNMVPAGWDLLAGELERNPVLAKRFFSRMRVLQYGGAALSQSTCDRIQAVARASVGEGVTFATGYGATETGPTATNVHWPNLTMGLMGLPVPGTTVKLTPAQGRLEFRVKGPQVCAGYYRNPEATRAAFDEEGFYVLGDAARLADPERPERGLVFDGRLSENFKLSSGVFVTAGALRVAALSAIGGAAADAVVCGEGKGGAGLLIFLNRPFCEAHFGGPLGCDGDAIRQAITEGLRRLNHAGGGGAGRITRALILDDQPHAPSGEITDKGYINQALARSRRAADVERLFAEPAGRDVIIP